MTRSPGLVRGRARVDAGVSRGYGLDTEDAVLSGGRVYDHVGVLILDGRAV